jgi:hypothetical protein
LADVENQSVPVAQIATRHRPILLINAATRGDQRLFRRLKIRN